MSLPALDLDGVSVRFGAGAQAIRAVDGVSFSVARGEAFGVIGESGSGKSTILRAICGLAPCEGAVRIDGRPAPAPRDLAFCKRVQMVFQDPYGSLHPRRLVRATLMEPLAIHRFGDRERRVARALEQVGLDPAFAYRYPHQLSGGQRQRVAIARCLVLEPEILLLDEPTSALDVSVQAGVLNLLDDLRRAHGLTYVFVSHDLRVVAHMCARVGVMLQGAMIEEIDAGDLRAGRAARDYTRSLISSAEGPGPAAGRRHASR